MRARLALFVVASIVLVWNFYEMGEREPLLLGIVGLFACGSMIFFGRVWTDYILPFGFWESFARDAGQSARSAPAVAFLGWLLLGLMSAGVLTN